MEPLSSKGSLLLSNEAGACIRQNKGVRENKEGEEERWVREKEMEEGKFPPSSVEPLQGTFAATFLIDHFGVITLANSSHDFLVMVRKKQ